MIGAKIDPPARPCLASACVLSAQLAARVETFLVLMWLCKLTLTDARADLSSVRGVKHWCALMASEPHPRGPDLAAWADLCGTALALLVSSGLKD